MILLLATHHFHYSEDIYTLNKYKKDFIVLRFLTAIQYKLPSIMIAQAKLYAHADTHGASLNFKKPDNSIKRVAAIWYTTIKSNINKPRVQPIKPYEPKNYFKYNNYDAIHIDKIKDIPYNYEGIMGVPITIICNYDWTKDYEIIKFGKGNDNKGLNYTDSKGNKIEPYTRILIKHK